MNLQMHGKGSRHIAAESRLKERELMKQEELKKRIALSNESTDCEGLSLSTRQFKSSSKPLIERTRKAAFETLHHRTHEQNDVNYCYDIKSKQHPYFFSPKSQPASKERLELSPSVKPESGKSDERNNTSRPSGDAGKMLAEQMMELQNRREKELKFTAAGWKRDCHGKWFRDENVSTYQSKSTIKHNCFLLEAFPELLLVGWCLFFFFFTLKETFQLAFFMLTKMLCATAMLVI